MKDHVTSSGFSYEHVRVVTVCWCYVLHRYMYMYLANRSTKEKKQDLPSFLSIPATSASLKLRHHPEVCLEGATLFLTAHHWRKSTIAHGPLEQNNQDFCLKIVKPVLKDTLCYAASVILGEPRSTVIIM